MRPVQGQQRFPKPLSGVRVPEASPNNNNKKEKIPMFDDPLAAFVFIIVVLGVLAYYGDRA